MRNLPCTKTDNSIDSATTSLFYNEAFAKEYHLAPN